METPTIAQGPLVIMFCNPSKIALADSKRKTDYRDCTCLSWFNFHRECMQKVDENAFRQTHLSRTSASFFTAAQILLSLRIIAYENSGRYSNIVLGTIAFVHQK